MRAYIYDEQDSGDQRQTHDSGVNVSLDDLRSIGVLPFPNADINVVDKIAKERGYVARDEINVSKQGLGDQYEAKIKMFFNEHLHEDEEIRWIRDGEGYFDVRSRNDKQWIRIKVEEGDLIVLPPGIYHRFTLSDTDYIKAVRLFQEQPKWTPINRGPAADEVPSRNEYLSTLKAPLIT